MYAHVFKRSMDIFGAIFFLLAIFPLLLAVYLILLITTGSAIFTQERVGYKGKIFKIYKFKTMLDKRGPSGEPLPDEERLTKFGIFLRNWSIDELPGLLNVLKGDMSLIGPRPMVKQYLPMYTKEQFRRHNVLPGITGWAQIMGRNALSWEEKIVFDLWYVDNQSYWLDLKIALLTPYIVLKSDNINGAGQETLKAFDLY